MVPEKVREFFLFFFYFFFIFTYGQRWFTLSSDHCRGSWCCKGRKDKRHRGSAPKVVNRISVRLLVRREEVGTNCLAWPTKVRSNDVVQGDQ